MANAVAALSEISDASPTAAAMMEINSQTINKLLTALNECTEWVARSSQLSLNLQYLKSKLLNTKGLAKQ